MRSKFIGLFLIVAVAGALACGGLSTEPAPTLSMNGESATTRYYFEPGDVVDTARQEAFNAWALTRLELTLPRKIEFRKYSSRSAMSRYTGTGNTNAFAEPETFRIHTIWPWDNHEVVHIFSALVGRPSDFFNEGFAVSFQADPMNRDFTVRFNGMQVHEACRGYRHGGTLPLPLSRYVTTAGFRALPDDVMSYRMAGSFVLFLEERYGLSRVLAFFRASGRDDSLATIESKFLQAFGERLEEAETGWLVSLQ
jgi:hypothetical protein